MCGIYFQLFDNKKLSKAGIYSETSRYRYVYKLKLAVRYFYKLKLAVKDFIQTETYTDITSQTYTDLT